MADRRLRRMMTGKIHRATVTGADLHYVGSVTVDADLLDAADVTNGARLTTYAIPGDRGSGVLTINGAAAHLVGEGDIVILISYSLLDDASARAYRPHVVFVDADNRVVERGAEPGRVPPGHGLTSAGLPFADARG